LVAVFYFYLTYDYIRVSLNDDKLDEYLQYIVQVAGEEQRPPREIRQLILVKADDLNLPLRGEHITVNGEGQTLKVSVLYDVNIKVPIVARGVYQKEFQHHAAYHRPGY
jgi:hypothetical protein